MIKTKFKAHPIMIFSLMKPYLFVLVLPLIRALIQYITTNQIDGLLNLEIIAFSLVLCIAILSYKAISVTVHDRYLTVKKGIIIKKYAKIELSRLSCIALRKNLLDYIFGSVDCAINTEAGRPQKSDFSFKMYSKDTKRLFLMLYGKGERDIIRFSPTKIALLAATTSSAFSGMLIGVPIVNQLGDLLGLALSDMFLSEINSISSKINTVFPPIVNTITIVLLIAYGFSVLVTFLKNVNFKLQTDNNSVEIKSGLIVRRHIIFKKSKINNICVEQNPLMRMAGRFSMRASIGGYGDKRGEKSVVVPIASYGGLQKELKRHFPELTVKGEAIEPIRSSISRNRFFFVPTVLFIVIVTASVVSAVFFEYFTSLILFLTIVLLSVDLYYAYVCYRKYKYSRLWLDKNVYASSTVAFNTRELYCNKTNIGIIKILQTPADVRFKTCKIKLTVRSEYADSIRVDNLSVDTVRDKLKESFNLQNLLI